MLVHNDDSEREYAYGANSKIGSSAMRWWLRQSRKAGLWSAWRTIGRQFSRLLAPSN